MSEGKKSDRQVMMMTPSCRFGKKPAAPRILAEHKSKRSQKMCMYDVDGIDAHDIFYGRPFKPKIDEMVTYRVTSKKGASEKNE